MVRTHAFDDMHNLMDDVVHGRSAD
jgi:hypothetical protein